MLEERLHGAKGSIGQAAAEALRLIVRHVEMLLVEEALELMVIGLNLRLGGSSEESMPLGELEGVAEHVQLRECGLVSLGTPVLLEIVHCSTPVLDLLLCPLLLVQEVIV